MTSLPDRFWIRVDKSAGDDGCWIWIGAKSPQGYGSFCLDGRRQYVHRLSLADSGVTIPPKHDVDHICHVRACVNPRHLRPVTRSQNNQNHSGAMSHSRSGIRGVHPAPKGRGWRVQVKLDGKVRFSGTYPTIEEAAAAARDMRNRLFTHNDIDRVPAASCDD